MIIEDSIINKEIRQQIDHAEDNVINIDSETEE